MITKKRRRNGGALRDASASPRRFAKAKRANVDVEKETHDAMGSQNRTNKARTKRDAVPNNAKARKQIAKLESAKKPGITYAQKRKAEKAARDALKMSGNSARASNDQAMRREGGVKYGALEVRYRALAKKLRQIEDLERKRSEGTRMDAQQTKKLKRKEYLEAEMKNLEKLISGEAGDKEEEDEEDEEEEDEEMSEEDEEEDDDDDDDEEEEEDEDDEEDEEEEDDEEEEESSEGEDEDEDDEEDEESESE